ITRWRVQTGIEMYLKQHDDRDTVRPVRAGRQKHRSPHTTAGGRRQLNPGAGGSVLPCCGATQHAWEAYRVERDWVPPILRCLIVGENPGNTNSTYFYAVPEDYGADEVVVRRA